jgi:hypothetical protein
MLQVLHMSMEAATGGADYCPGHSHLGTYKQCQVACSKGNCFEGVQGSTTLLQAQ